MSSSIAGWKDINESDMILMPDTSTAFADPFYDEPTINVTCDVIEPADGSSYEKDPRGIAKKAEKYLSDSGVADTAFFGPENEFFVFDDVKFEDTIGSCFFKVDSSEASDESTLKKQLPIVSSNLTSSKTKNSFSGPKKAVSATPESDKYFSAFFAIPLGSFS